LRETARNARASSVNRGRERLTLPASRRSFRFTRRREKLVRAFVDQLPGLYRDGVLTRRALAEAHRQLRQDRPTLDEKREALAHDIARAERALQRDDAAFEAGMLDSRLEILPTCRVATPEVRALPSSVGGTCQCANQAIFMASALDLSSRNG
jgi:hypothetical protein